MEEILLGTVDRTILVFIPDPASTDGSGKTGLTHADLTVSYTRVETDNDVVVTDATGSLSTLTNLTDAHADWGVKEVSSTLAPGLYRLDVADAVFASGAWYAVVYVEITTSAAAATPKAFKLVDFDMQGQSAIDLKDFADAGYDPATNKVQGVVLVDTVTTYTGNTPQTGDSFARIGANGASLTSLATAAELAKVPKSDSNVTWNATAAAQMQSEANDALVAYDAATGTDVSDAVTTINTSIVRLYGLVIVNGTNGSTGNDTTHIHLEGLTFGNDELNDYVIVIHDPGSDELHRRVISDWVLATELATLDVALPFTPGAGTCSYWILAQPVGGGGSGPTASQISDAVWTEAIADHSGVSGSTAEALAAAGGAGDPWITTLPGSYSSGQAGFILGTNLNAAISSRMATYTQPTGFLAATFPTTVASPTNITGGTITTVTNLTNAPTVGDFTATMKSSITTAASSATPTVTLADDAITAAKFDESTAFPTTSVDTGATRIARTGADSDTLETLSDEVAALNNVSLAGIFAGGDVDGYTLEESLKLILAACAGELSGAATTTIVIRAADDSKPRITATVDVDGNRTALTLDETG